MFAFRHVLTIKTPMGRRFRGQSIDHGKPLVRTKASDLEAAGVQRVDRISGMQDGLPVTAHGDVLQPNTVVWCTGYRSDYSWIDLQITDDHGQLHAERGVSAEADLYFIGAEFQYAVASATIQGLDQDARYLLRAMAKQPAAATPVPQKAAA
jgi:putative flavoprotein involved in K+ transport